MVVKEAVIEKDHIRIIGSLANITLLIHIFDAVLQISGKEFFGKRILNFFQ
jgi:hypothetical protein